MDLDKQCETKKREVEEFFELNANTHNISTAIDEDKTDTEISIDDQVANNQT